MRIYTNLIEAVKETERDLYEMGIVVHPQTMQDKDITDNEDYMTKEIRGYGFKLVDWKLDLQEIKAMLKSFFPDNEDDALHYVLIEFQDRINNIPQNPGKSYKVRNQVWSEFLHNGKFSYTYSERINPQLKSILHELITHPDTRQAIINIHSNICPIMEESFQDVNKVTQSADLWNIGGRARIPCSLYYQLMIREHKMDLIYAMRSCDLLTHFPIDISLALMFQDWFRDRLDLSSGTFTYFTGSLHSYQKDMKTRGIF